jgi:Domain of unknown function (DUF222)/HNH endonuclease
LDPITGQSLKNLMYALAKPTSKDDDRTAGQRRVDALHQLCDERLRYGAPTDHGHRPHLLVTVTRPRLNHAISATGRPDRRGCPYVLAVLHGYGSISDSLLAQLACDADQTEVTVDEAGTVLDVGRVRRLATPQQRIAVFTRQGGICAAPGCTNTHLEIHHWIPWSEGGRTDLKDLAGYCSRCHHLIHQGLLVVTPDGNGGWVHHDRRGRRLHDRRRDADQANRDHLHHLAHQTFDDPGDHRRTSNRESDDDGGGSRRRRRLLLHPVPPNRLTLLEFAPSAVRMAPWTTASTRARM